MKVANLQKQWLEPLDLFGKTDLPAETQTKKMTHIVGMQPANQGDCSKCFWGDIDCASVPWPNRKDMQQPASQIYAPKLWAGPDEPPKPVPQHIGRTLMKNVLPRASQTSNRPHAKLPSPGKPQSLKEAYPR